MRARSLAAVALLALAGTISAVASERAAQGSSADALRIARDSRSHWSLGRLAVRSRPGKPERVKAELVYGGAVVATLRVDPVTGDFLAKGERGHAPEGPVDLASLRAAVERALDQLDVGGWAWPSKHGSAWGVPLQYQGHVVGKIKVDVPNRRVLSKDDDDD